MRRQSNAECPSHTEQGCQARIAILAQRLVERLTRNARLPRDRGHTARPSDHTQGVTDVACVSTGQSVIEQFLL